MFECNNSNGYDSDNDPVWTMECIDNGILQQNKYVDNFLYNLLKYLPIIFLKNINLDFNLKLTNNYSNIEQIDIVCIIAFKNINEY